MMIFVVIIAAVGLAISLYGMMVERKVKQNMQYKAACDISDTVSCTKSFTSPYNKLLGFSNIVACLLYYVAMMFFGMIGNAVAVTVLAWAGLLVTIYFAYILYFKVKTICLICTSLYIVNIALVIVQYIN